MIRYTDRYDTLASFTAFRCRTMHANKGDRVYECSRSGYGKHIINKRDCFGNLIIENSVILTDCVIICDVNDDGEEYKGSRDAFILYTPFIRQVVAESMYNEDTSFRKFGKYDHKLYTRGKVTSLIGKGIHIDCPGGFIPMIPDGYAAIEEFSMNGTGYTLVPLVKVF